MLAGVGGATIAEAKERLSYEEVGVWLDYIKRKGPVDIYGRLEWGFALLAAIANNAAGGKAKQRDFMPYASRDGVESEEGVSPEQLFQMFKGATKGLKRAA